MAYKPYKVQKSQDIYAKYDKKNQKKNTSDGGNVKLFGFRSGLSYKMIPAILYYAFMLFYIGTGIYGEIRYYKFEPMDILLMVLKYIFFIVWFFSPAIFLSDFKYRDSLPFFKKRNIGSSLIGLILVSMFCSFMTYVYKDCMSDTYKASVQAYAKVLEEEQKENEIKNTTTKNVETTSEIVDETTTGYVDEGNGDNYAYDIFSDTEEDNNKNKDSDVNENPVDGKSGKQDTNSDNNSANNKGSNSDSAVIDDTDAEVVTTKKDDAKSENETNADNASGKDSGWTDFY